MAILKRGGNTLIERQLYRVDGTTPLLISELVTIQAKIIQNDRVLATYTLKPIPADGQIRQGSSTSKVEIEITKALSDTFREGPVNCKLILEETDADFISDGEFNSPEEFEMFTVES